jgi:hypothetical protein
MQTQFNNGNGTGIMIIGNAAATVPFPAMISNLSAGHAVLNLYTTNFPEPLTPMGCCNNAEVSPNCQNLPPHDGSTMIVGFGHDGHCSCSASAFSRQFLLEREGLIAWKQGLQTRESRYSPP